MPPARRKIRDAQIAQLFARSARAPGLGPFVPATLQPVWHQDYVAGSNTNDGLTAATAVKTVSEIYRRWQGGVLGSRPRLLASSSIFMHAPVQLGPSQFSDPLLVLADVDLAAGVKVIVRPAAPTIKRSSALSSIVTPFARTSTGRLTVHDNTVADWTSDNDLLFIDTTQNATSWVTGPIAANAFLAAVRPTQALDAASLNALVVTGLGPPVTTGATDAYQIVRPLDVYFGSGSETRCFPNGSDPNVQTGVFFARLRGLPAFAGESMSGRADGLFDDVALTPIGSFVFFIECAFGVNVVWQSGGIAFVNCSLQQQWTIGDADTSAFSGGALLLAGYGKADRVFAQSLLIDQDYATIVVGPGGIIAILGENNFFGNVGRYSDNGGEPFLLMQGAVCVVGVAYDFGAPFAVLYGTVNGPDGVVRVESLAKMSVGQPGTFMQWFQFDNNFFQLGGLQVAFGFNEATGAYVGPTACTFAHLDAALAAGTGFGGTAINPNTISSLGIDLF